MVVVHVDTRGSAVVVACVTVVEGQPMEGEGSGSSLALSHSCANYGNRKMTKHV